MWQSSSRRRSSNSPTPQHKHSLSLTTSSSSSSSSSTSTSTKSSFSSIKSPPFSMQQKLATPNPKSPSSLEDVWKDIRLFNPSSSHSSSSSKSKDINLNTTTSSPLIFQDFLGKDSLMKSSARCVVPPASPFPADTFLSLTPVSHPCFATLFKEKQQQQPPLLRSPSLSDSGFCSSSGGGCGVKRDMDPGSDSAGGDHRHKRMIKNRESACRSRARKQAYTNDLEIAVSNLKKENAILKDQLNQVHSAAAAQQHSRKNPLKRTFTAPF